MIKTNQISSAGWILSIGKIRKKLWTNQLPSLKWYVKYVIQSENQQNEHRPSASFTFHAKIYLKKPWGQGWVETKITWTETFVRSKNFIKWKTSLNRGILARSSQQRYSVKKDFLEMSQNSQENTCARVPFLIKLQTSGLQLY